MEPVRRLPQMLAAALPPALAAAEAVEQSAAALGPGGGGGVGAGLPISPEQLQAGCSTRVRKCGAIDLRVSEALCGRQGVVQRGSQRHGAMDLWAEAARVGDGETGMHAR